jgi:hypothetical protein
MGPTHRSLTGTGEGYSLEGTSFPHTSPRHSQPMVSHFHLWALPGLQFIQVLSTKLEFEFKGTYGRHVVFQPLGLYRGLQLCLAIANDLSLAIGSSRKDRKVALMQLGHQFNSYNLIHIQES